VVRVLWGEKDSNVTPETLTNAAFSNSQGMFCHDFATIKKHPYFEDLFILFSPVFRS
jgi:hypothetical protein